MALILGGHYFLVTCCKAVQLKSQLRGHCDLTQCFVGWESMALPGVCESFSATHALSSSLSHPQ